MAAELGNGARWELRHDTAVPRSPPRATGQKALTNILVGQLVPQTNPLRLMLDGFAVYDG